MTSANSRISTACHTARMLTLASLTGDLSKPMASDTTLSRYSSVRTTPKASRTRSGVWLRGLLTTSPTARKALLSLVLMMTRRVLFSGVHLSM